MPQMMPTELLAFNHRKQQAQNEFKQLNARAGLVKGNAFDDYARQKRDIGVDYKRVRNAMPTQWNSRGMLVSGLHNQAQRELSAERARQISDALAKRTRATSAADLDVSQGRTSMNLVLQQLDAMKSARVTELNSELEGVDLGRIFY